MATTHPATEASGLRFHTQISSPQKQPGPGLSFLQEITPTPSYCEENVYLVAKAAATAGHLLDGVYAVVISNAAKQIPVWAQRCSQQPDGLAVWDYHVLLVALAGSSLASAFAHGGGPIVVDVDTTLPLPCALRLYAQRALRGELTEPEDRRLYRIIPAADYLESFASDRSHMLRPGVAPPLPGATPSDIAGLYISAPPPYPCIVSKKGETNTLPRYLEMPSYSGAAGDWRSTALTAGDALPYGVVLTQNAFLNFMEHVHV